jgi:hypothetical protein
MPWRHAPLSVIVSAPLWCGRFLRATGRSWVCYHLQASGTVVPAVQCQQERAQRRDGGRTRGLAASLLHPPRRADGGVCAMLKFSRLLFSKFRLRSVPSGHLPKELESARMEAIKHWPGPVSRTGFIAVRSLGALQQRFTAGCRMRQAWMSFLQDQGAHSPQCAECEQDPPALRL